MLAGLFIRICSICCDIGPGRHENITRESDSEKCDDWQMFRSDLAALEAVEKAAQSQPALLKLVVQITEVRSTILDRRHPG